MNIPTSPRPPGAPAGRPGFLDGTAALFSGLGFVLRTPAVWPLAVVPVAVGTGATALLGAGAMRLLVPAIARGFGPRWGLLASVVDAIVGVVVLLVAALVGFGLAQPLSGPALNRIVRRVEAELGAPPRPATGLLEDMGRALQSVAVSYAVGLPILALLAAVSFLFPPASVVTFPLKIVVLAMLIAWDLCDYPLSLQGVPVATRVALVTRNAPAMIGFGFGLALLSLLPCALIVTLPVGVAGATRLTRRLQGAEGARRE